MSYFFRGGRADIETGLPGFIPDSSCVVHLQSLKLQLALLDREFDDIGKLSNISQSLMLQLDDLGKLSNILQSLRLQLCLYRIDYDALSALDSDNITVAPSMTEEEIGALPVHKYEGQPHQGSPTSCERQEPFFSSTWVALL
ncbi:hypothetical protein Cni_G19618 [Canna indica]|uniref:Uncharacterized protein n=1 Tax=Canna indica TaxID=4628 RepID=A0AAQ3QH33_9LILI|nr:hypothetical protein Cni_G19618 [Canna indica]